MEVLSESEKQQYKKLVADSQATGNISELKQFINDKVSCRTEGKPANFGDGAHYSCPAQGGKRRKRRKSRKTRTTRKTRGRKSSKRRMRYGGGYDANDFKSMYSSATSSLSSMKTKADAMKSKADMEAKKLTQAYSGGKRRRRRTRRGGDYGASEFQKMYDSAASSLASMKDKAVEMKDKASEEAKRLTQAYSGGKRRSRRMRKGRKTRRTRRR